MFLKKIFFSTVLINMNYFVDLTDSDYIGGCKYFNRGNQPIYYYLFNIMNIF